jgi:hypothetical protein
MERSHLARLVVLSAGLKADMIDHLKHSRVSKALTDRANGAGSFAEAEARLQATRITVILAPDQAATAAGQAAALTIMNTSFKCFQNVALVCDPKIPLKMPLPIGVTIGAAAHTLHAIVTDSVPDGTTHVLLIGRNAPPGTTAFVRCWWDGWSGGILPAWDERPLGHGGNPLAGVFSGAVAVREVFATVLQYPRCGSRVSLASLWDPQTDPTLARPGPDTVYLSRRLWFIGLGHVGQGFLWNLGLLPIREIDLVLQDDQNTGVENEATGLLTHPGSINTKKTRIAAAWLDRPAWSARLIERRHYGDIPLLDGDPCIAITSLDERAARIKIAGTGFDYMIDAGIGHGVVDFEALQIRILARGLDASKFWSSPERSKDIDSLMEHEAYSGHAAASGRCGALTLANASVSVPFVGAATGALTIAQAIRLASMQTTVQMMQVELGTPGMAIIGATNDAVAESRGSTQLNLT